MERDARRCDAVREPLLGRRSVLALASLGALAPAAARAEASGLGLADLVDPDGRATDLARSLAGMLVGVSGYLAPSLDGREFALTEGPLTPCQLCGAPHDAGGSAAVQLDAPDRGAPAFKRVQVLGRLEIDGLPRPGVRLAAARIQAV